LLFRDEISRDKFDEGMRELAYLDPNHIDHKIALHEYWPQLGTVVGWMSRGIADDQRQGHLQTDEGFDDALTDQVREWTKNIGIDDDMLRYHWRASWSPLPWSAASELYRRGIAGTLPPGFTFDAEDLRESLRANSVPPAYWQGMIASIFSPLGIRQLRTVYDENLMTDVEVQQRLVSEGLELGDAQALTKLYAKQKPAYRRRKIGVGGAHEMTRLYAEGAMGVDEYREELQAEGFDDDEIEEAVDEAKAERLRLHRRELVRFLKAKFTRGEASLAQVQSVLGAVGLGSEDIADLLRLWQTEFELHPRQESARTLLDWYGKGLMREGELVQALGQLRYSDVDIARMIAAWEMDTTRKKLKEAESLMAKAESRQTKQERAWATDLRAVNKILGDVGKRTRTPAGKLLSWVEWRAGKPTTLAKKGPPANGTSAALLAAASGESAADIDAAVANELGGTEGGFPPPPETSPGSEGAGGGASEPTLGSEPAAGSAPGPSAGP
jgi:hypothetical protein